jgi:glycine amidinotransferase
MYYSKSLLKEVAMTQMERTVVNSWNEWDPLKHVIVGRADGTMVQAPEPAVRRDWPEHGFPYGTYGPLPKEMEQKANLQLDNFAKVLESRGIRVDRPTPLDFSQKVQTPDWQQDSMFGCMPPRDLLLTVGNEILEATMSFRSRWFEFLCYRPLLERYFKEDPKFRWETAPKPRLTEKSYQKNFYETWNNLDDEKKWTRAKSSDWILTDKEPLFDAADIARCGKDLFVQKSMVTNDAGINWLRRHYPDLRIHKVRYKEELPWHIDSTLIPLRAGLVMINPVRTPLEEGQKKLFEANDWEILEAPKTVRSGKGPLEFCSLWLNMNILVLDPKTVCVEASETPVQKLLDKYGFEVIPVPLYDVAAFGGGLHCSTADVHREGSLEDYFPNQIEDF